ncbi:MAG TPA: hypothetical protein VGG89_14215 [Candidatus Baltobacteraceae bacterium]|jgi:hypothetical protein
MKAQHVLGVVASVAIAAVLVETFYQHPTYGNGIQAAYAVAKAALAIG